MAQINDRNDYVIVDQGPIAWDLFSNGLVNGKQMEFALSYNDTHVLINCAILAIAKSNTKLHIVVITCEFASFENSLSSDGKDDSDHRAKVLSKLKDGAHSKSFKIHYSLDHLQGHVIVPSQDSSRPLQQ